MLKNHEKLVAKKEWFPISQPPTFPGSMVKVGRVLIRRAGGTAYYTALYLGTCWHGVHEWDYDTGHWCYISDAEVSQLEH